MSAAPGTVILVRHGTHDEVGRVLSGRSEIALNATGRVEATGVAAVLGGGAVASLHSSPRRRAVETAAPLAAATWLRTVIAPALDEIDFGAFTGRSFDALDADPDWYHWNAERGKARCPGGETMAEASGRAFAYIRSLPPESFPAVCVTHCDVIRGIVADVLGLRYAGMFAYDCAPASRTTLELSGGAVRLVALNERVRA